MLAPWPAFRRGVWCYLLAGVLHIVVFFGFLILAARSVQMVVLGFVPGFVLPGLGGALGAVYDVVKDVASTAVLLAVVILAVRRAYFRPARYAVPESWGRTTPPRRCSCSGSSAR